MNLISYDGGRTWYNSWSTAPVLILDEIPLGACVPYEKIAEALDHRGYDLSPTAQETIR